MALTIINSKGDRFVKWKVYYTGGKTFSDKDGSPFNAPPTGAQVIVKTDSLTGRVLLSCCDYYWWDSERDAWYGGDSGGYYQYMMTYIGPKNVLFGQYISNEEFHDITVKALADPDFPTKSAKHPSDGYLP